jgi:hypothetical protein
MSEDIVCESCGPDRPCKHELAAHETPQRIEPLAIMVGEFARDFVPAGQRMEAVDRLYVLLQEARRG